MRKYNLAQVSFLIACGSALQLAETFVLHPIPGLRIGLANIGTVLALALFGIPAGLEVAVFRPVITSLTNGTFLSPGFVLNFCASVSSFFVMAAMYYLTWRKKLVSIIGISILGALSHNLTQIAVAYFWLIPHRGILALAPILVISAVIGGYLVGWSSNYVLVRIAESQLVNFPAFEKAGRETVPLPLLLREKIKIITAFVMILSTIFLTSIAAYLVLIALVIILIVAYRQSIAVGWMRLLSLWGMIAFSFLLPVLFSPQGPLLWHWKWITITETGLAQGLLFSLRLIFLVFISIWIGVAEPSRLSEELAWILSPLKYFRFSVDRIPRLTSLSLSFIPVIWEKFNKVKPKTLRTVLDVLAAFFIGLE